MHQSSRLTLRRSSIQRTPTRCTGSPTSCSARFPHGGDGAVHGLRPLCAMKSPPTCERWARAGVAEDGRIRALREGRFRGAGLDVFETEPLPKESPLWGM